MRQDLDLSAFSKGELSPRLKGRTDYKGYFEGCDTMLNFVVLPQGGATRRPGTLYVANVKDQTNGARLVDFQFSTVQAYVLEFGHLYIRVYKNGAPVVSDLVATNVTDNGFGVVRITMASTAGLYTGNTAVVTGVTGVPGANGTWLITVHDSTHIDLNGSSFTGLWTGGGDIEVTVEIPTAYTTAQVNELHWCQSNDVLYLCHPDVPPATLSRSSHTDWSLDNIFFLDGPYFDQVFGQAALSFSSATGTTTVTAASTDGINDGQGFLTTDVGRIIRAEDSGTSAPWGWVKLTVWTSSTQMTGEVQNVVNNGAIEGVPAGPTTEWQFGAWSHTTGYPSIPQFWQNRLFFLGSKKDPTSVVFSSTGDYANMAPTKSDSTVVESNGGVFGITGNSVNAVRWASAVGSAQTPQLGIGTASDEHILQSGGAQGTAFSATSVQVYEETSLTGRSNARTVRVGKATLFANAPGRKLHEFQFNWQVNGYVGPDKSIESEHLTRGQIADLDFQRTPYGVIWVRMANGNLMGMTYLPEQQINAWHRHELGGNYYGGAARVESIVCIPSPDETYDQLWMIVARTVDGAVLRTIELMGEYFDNQHQEDAVFVDCAFQSTRTTQGGTLTFDTIALATTVTFTDSAGGFVSGDVGSVIRALGGIGVIQAFVDTHTVTGQWMVSPSNTMPPPSWTKTAQHTTFSGLDTLEGETLQIFGDGADLSTATVASGSVTVPNGGSASFATIGEPITFRLITMPWATQQAVVTQGHYKNINMLWLRFLSSLGCDFGRRMTDQMTGIGSFVTEPLEIRSAGDLVGWAPPLYTGIQRLPVQGGYDLEGQIVIQGSGPYPCTVLALVATADVGELAGGSG